MPEYLSPGVYVEEVNTGSKPIEGVSTSTAGTVGVAERGPENVATLLTSPGDYGRLFGGQLAFDEFRDGTGRSHAYLPYAVDGFFTNGGRRLYVVRVLPEDAEHATRELFAGALAGGEESVLLRSAAENTGTAVSGPLLYALDRSAIGANDWIRLGDGSRAEYRRVSPAAAAAANHVSLSSPLVGAYAGSGGVALAPKTLAAAAGIGTFSVVGTLEAGATGFALQEAAAGDAAKLQTRSAAGVIALELGPPGVGELVVVPQNGVIATGAVAAVTLDTPLPLAPASSAARQLDVSPPATPPTLAFDAHAGDLVVYASDTSGLVPLALPAVRLVLVMQGTTLREVRRSGRLARFDLTLGAYAAYPASALVRQVTLADATSLVTAGPPVQTARVFVVDDATGLVPGLRLTIGTETGTLQSVAANTLTLTANLTAAPATGTTVTPITELTAPAAAGTVVLALASRLGLESDSVVRVGTFPDEELATIAQVPGPRGVAPDAGNVILTVPLRRSQPTGALVTRQRAPVPVAARQPTFTVLGATAGAESLFVTDGTSFASGNVVAVELASGARYYHRLAGVDTTLAPGPVELTEALELTHEVGSALAERAPLFDLIALDRGGWGNRLLVSVADEEAGLASQAEIVGVSSAFELRLSNVTGIEPGSVLEPSDAAGTVLAPLLKVRAVDRTNRLVTLDAPGAVPAPPVGTRVRSREFRLTVYLLRRPDPAVPTRDELLEDSEVFRHLSMDVRHSRYVQRVLGTTWDPTTGTFLDDGEPGAASGTPLRLSDSRSVGASAYVRARDLAPDRATAESIRLGPEALVDVLPSGRERPARHRFAGGDDAVSTMTDTMYLGADSAEPRLRSGIFALDNVQDISLVAVPGQTTAPVQQALIDHCELARYRFAVLDAQGPSADALEDVQAQRQQFDSKYAALYHPWLTIRDPLPPNPADVRDVAIPPSLHLLGIYARTDVERGVHKAPANEVVRGITGLTRALNKGEQDILNPFPKNINVIRDFRSDNRGLRVWGARVITSDSDYKYVNVRRLLIFLEASIDRGLQWVVFEPNAEELWGRVRRAITNFLTVVWRNGALEGATPAEGFYVKCDRTTMTQQDIDNGRLICMVGVAPVKPAEFVIVRIGLWTANSQQ